MVRARGGGAVAASENASGGRVSDSASGSGNITGARSALARGSLDTAKLVGIKVPSFFVSSEGKFTTQLS